MAEAKKVTASTKVTSPKLAPASESGDPVVHQLLAEIQTARANGNGDEVKVCQQKLADLGYQ